MLGCCNQTHLHYLRKNISISNHNLHPESLLATKYKVVRDLNLNDRPCWPTNLLASPIQWVTRVWGVTFPSIHGTSGRSPRALAWKSCGNRWHLRCPHSALPHWWRWITFRHWVLILAYSPHTTGRLSQIRKTPATWAQTMKMPAKPWFMWRWIRCIYCFISSNKKSLPSCHSGTVSVNACHTCVVVYTVSLPNRLRCKLANQIKPPLF